MADTCRPATSLPLPIPSLGALGLLSRCNPVSSPSCERPPILFLPHVKCSVSDVVPTNPNTSYSTVRNMLQREASSELVPPVRTRWRALSTMESQARRKKNQLLTGGCVSNQGSQSGAVRKATVGSDQLRLIQASELSRFPDFGCAQCSPSPAPQAHIAHKSTGCGRRALQPAVALPTVDEWVRSGMASACRGLLLQGSWPCCVARLSLRRRPSTLGLSVSSYIH